MSDLAVIGELFIGPAVVVDDTLGSADSTMRPIVDQIRDRQIPVLTETTIPPLSELKHWRDFSLIVLDWELFPSSQGAGGLVPGVALPDALYEDNAVKVSAFIKALLDELYCPIFIFSSRDVATIESQLTSQLGVGAGSIGSRIMVRSKSDVSTNLFEALTAWVATRPSIYALKSWDHGYKLAKRDLFAEFHAASPNWPKLLWKTAGVDSVNPHSELTETITSNLLHRFRPLKFDEAILGSADDDGVPDPPDALRRVIHRQAAISRQSLHDDVLMPGDYFFDSPEKEDGLPASILINVTPACDLVARSKSMDDISLTLVRADLVSDEENSWKKDVSVVEKERAADYSSSHILYVLTDSARPYRIRFKNWSRDTWGSVREKRQGRLLEPHITQLQQKFALYFHRQGLPRLPEAYFYRPGE